MTHLNHDHEIDGSEHQYDEEPCSTLMRNPKSERIKEFCDRWQSEAVRMSREYGIATRGVLAVEDLVSEVVHLRRVISSLEGELSEHKKH